jgi:hypothetical protein
MFLLSSCEILKSSQKLINDVESKEKVKRIEINKGGVVFTDILPEKDRIKDSQGRIIDTIIIIKNNEITKTIYYKQDGSVMSQVDCPDTFISEEKESSFSDESKLKNKEKEENLNSDIILYLFIGVALLLIIFLVFVSIHIKKITSFKKTIF